MREIFSVTLVVLLIAGICSFALAEEPKGSMMGKEVVSEEAMMMKPGKMMEMCPMHKMMSKEMVATEDGGVVVMVGNKLFKYDKNLNLRKEVEIKMDMEGMQKMMKKMMEKCPMSQKMMKQGGRMGETAEESEGIGESEEKTKHKTHH